MFEDIAGVKWHRTIQDWRMKNWVAQPKMLVNKRCSRMSKLSAAVNGGELWDAETIRWVELLKQKTWTRISNTR